MAGALYTVSLITTATTESTYYYNVFLYIHKLIEAQREELF